MAIVSIHYDCGCGFHGRTVEEANNHVDTTGHTMTVAGSINPSKRRVHGVKAASYASTARRSTGTVSPLSAKTASTPALNELEVSGKVDFNNLRAMLQNRNK